VSAANMAESAEKRSRRATGHVLLLGSGMCSHPIIVYLDRHGFTTLVASRTPNASKLEVAIDACQVYLYRASTTSLATNHEQLSHTESHDTVSTQAHAVTLVGKQERITTHCSAYLVPQHRSNMSQPVALRT
jgi:hypothetical protein